MAKRVTESIIIITLRPWSRKYSAIAVAVNAAFRRTSAGWSDVAHDHDGAREALFAEVALHELEDLSTALADQADHVDLLGGRAGDHAQQRGLADAGAGEDADALAAAAGHERVQGPHAQRHALVDARARERIGRGRLGRAPGGVRDRALAVERTAEAVERAAEQRVGDVDLERLAGRDDLRARADARGLAQRHQQRAAGAEADDLGGHGGAAAAGLDRAHLTDLGLEAGGLGDQPDQVDHAAGAAVQVGLADRETASSTMSSEAPTASSALSISENIWGPYRPVADGTLGAARARRRRLRSRARAWSRRARRRRRRACARCATASDAALGLDLAVLDAAERRLDLLHRPAHDLEIVRVDHDR